MCFLQKLNQPSHDGCLSLLKTLNHVVKNADSWNMPSSSLLQWNHGSCNFNTESGNPSLQNRRVFLDLRRKLFIQTFPKQYTNSFKCPSVPTRESTQDYLSSCSSGPQSSEPPSWHVPLLTIYLLAYIYHLYFRISLPSSKPRTLPVSTNTVYR